MEEKKLQDESLECFKTQADMSFWDTVQKVFHLTHSKICKIYKNCHQNLYISMTQAKLTLILYIYKALGLQVQVQKTQVN